MRHVATSTFVFSRGALWASTPAASAVTTLPLLLLLLLLLSHGCAAVDDLAGSGASGAERGAPHARVANSNKNLHAVLENEMRALREDCLREIVSGWRGKGCTASEIAAENCALRCVSEACYDSTYGGDPLEEGEIDLLRGRDYRMCVRRELRASRSASPTFFL